MDKPSLDAVFMGPSQGPPKAPGDLGAMADETPPDEGDGEESEQALDDSIDEVFTTDDPVQRREAFKRAMQLCNQQGGGSY